MELITISAKNLGQVAMPEFCPKCFWIKLKVGNRLPWQMFPGIFSSIDAYTKHCVHAQIDGGDLTQWDWLSKYNVESYGKPPHWSKFKTVVKEYNIELTGGLDDILLLRDYEGYIIPDYKTAKYTENQDKLKPMYDVQLNGYCLISEDGLYYAPVKKLLLIYFEPITTDAAATEEVYDKGFRMKFRPICLEVDINREIVMSCLEKTREIYEMARAPESREGCKDCEALQNVIRETALTLIGA